MSRRRGALLLILAAVSGPAAAQNAYRWVDEKGVVQYSDQPPPQAIKKFEERKVQPNRGNAQLPFLTRKAAAAFPVTLFIGKDCSKHCDDARALLSRRGVPFSESRLDSAADAAAFTARFGSEPLLPSLTVGKDLETGFAAAAWEALLDRAGYPPAAPAPRP